MRKAAAVPSARRPKRRFGTIQEMSGGRWQARYSTPTGVRVTAPHTFELREHAETWLADHAREFNNPGFLQRLELAHVVRDGVYESFDPRGFFVYILWGADSKTPVYVGQSANVLARLGNHMGDPEKKSLTQRIQLIRCPTEDAMLDTELRLIREYRPILNVRDNRQAARGASGPVDGRRVAEKLSELAGWEHGR